MADLTEFNKAGAWWHLNAFLNEDHTFMTKSLRSHRDNQICAPVSVRQFSPKYTVPNTWVLRVLWFCPHCTDLDGDLVWFSLIQSDLVAKPCFWPAYDNIQHFVIIWITIQ